MNTLEKIQTRVGTKVDGIWGPKTLSAVADELGVKDNVKAIQAKVGVTQDGIVGPKTLSAIADALSIYVAPAKWPTQAEVRTGKSIFGKVGDEGNLVNITPPYPLYYDGKQVKTIRVHKLIADAVQRVLQRVLEHYGVERIHALGLDVYGGSYNFRKTTTGTKYSMHAWGVALDFDPEHNAYATKKPKARFSGPEYNYWWDCWEAEGFHSLGREADADWMHVQAPSLK
ncbi:MAG: hypothetical protein Q4C88_05845 [Akkermansia sp.]|nr:hypothetical protein [Akkermansia sp.]